jgi:hypothetical protein
MAFKKPESFEGLSLDDLRKLNDEAMAEGRELVAKGADLSDEEFAQAEALMQASEEIENEIASREQAESERAERLAALQAGFAETEDEVEEETETEDEPEDEPEAEADKEEPVAVTAAAPKRTVKRAATRAPREVAPEPEVEEEQPYRVSLVAAANVPNVPANHEFADMLEVATAFQSRSRGFTGNARKGDKPQIISRGGVDAQTGRAFRLSDSHQVFGVAQIRKPEDEFMLTERMSAQDQYDLVMSAAKESRLPGNSLVAAGGWCAPSEQVYGFCELETVSGLLSIPEVQARRGGISFTKGPDYAALAATWGFLQTEAQAEAGTVKVCHEIDCPDWEEVRLDAIGFCLTAPVLTNSAFPELINRVLQIGAVAHAHKVNAEIISRISTMIGTAINWAEVGGATSDVLDAAELQAERLRYTYSLAPGATIEAVFPIWAKGALRADVGRRLNIENPLNVTDAAMMAWFQVRGIAPQFVYDYQPLASGNTGTWTAWPTTLEFMMYPAGAYTKLAKDVIDLDTIYDSVGLSTNVYTAAFFEEGIAVANTCASGVKVSVALNTRGATGFPAVGSGSGVTYAAA